MSLGFLNPLFGFQGISLKRKTVGVINAEGPPVPIPNTAVKLSSAEDTCLATDRENRSMPTQFPLKGIRFFYNRREKCGGPCATGVPCEKATGKLPTNKAKRQQANCQQTNCPASTGLAGQNQIFQKKAVSITAALSGARKRLIAPSFGAAGAWPADCFPSRFRHAAPAIPAPVPSMRRNIPDRLTRRGPARPPAPARPESCA